MGWLGTYHKKPTGKLFPAGMNYLSDLIIRPGIEKCFGPLLLYRGSQGRGWAHRYWNASILMMANEAESIADGLKLFENPDFNQLCGPVKAPPKFTLATFLTRLEDNPGVTRNIPGLTDYVRSLEVGPCILTRVDRFSDDPDCAEWRVYRGEKARSEWKQERGIPVKEQLFYPFMVHDTGKPDDGFAMVKLVNSAVPAWLPEHIRADACQDLIVGLLSGDITPGQVHDRANEFVVKVWRMHPTKFDGHGGLIRSMNSPISSDDDCNLSEVI
jgi:hypothetical protein